MSNSGRSFDDIPALIADWNADNLTGADSSAVSSWTDNSPYQWALRQVTTASQPTLKKGILNGHSVVRTGASGWMQCTSFGPFAMPTTIMAVAKTSGTSGQRTLTSATISASVQSIFVDSTRNTWGIAAGSSAVGGDPADTSFHIFTAHFESGYASLSVDGIPVNVVNGVGTNPIYGMLLGQVNGGGSYWNGDIARLKIWDSKLTPLQESAEGNALAALYGLTFASPYYRLDFVDTTTSNGTAARVWAPQTGFPVSGPVVIYSHPHAQTEKVAPGNQGAAFIAACVAQGWPVIASNGHGNNWGNQNGIDDTVDAYTYMTSRMNVTSVVMAGSSMGGLVSALAIPDGRIPNIKALIGIDAVFNLANLFAANAGTYSTPIRTAYGIASDGSDYAAKTAGHDPALMTAGNFGTVAFRFYASSADVDVPKTANADQMAALVTNAPERGVVALTQTHLDPSHTMPIDAVTFIKKYVV